MRWSSPTISAIPRGVVPNRWDLLAVPLVLSVFFLFAGIGKLRWLINSVIDRPTGSS